MTGGVESSPRGVASEFSIEPFRGDFEALERMAHASWRDEYGDASFPNFYRPEFLHYLFDRLPADKRDHLVAAYRGEEIAGFLANLPQRFHFRGREFRATYSCLLVTRREFLRRGVALALVRKALETNQKYRYDFALLTLEAGHRSTKMMDKLRAEGERLEWVRKSGVLGRVLNLRRVRRSEGLKWYETAAIRLLGSHRRPKREGLPLREYGPRDLGGCAALLGRYRESAGLALIWDANDLAVELDWPGVSQTLVFEKAGRVAGLVNFIAHEHLGRTVERWAWVNHLAYPDLTPKEQYLFVQSYLENIRIKGFIGTIEWKRGIYPTGPLIRSRFFPYPRAVNLLSWTFNPEISLASIPDVYEVQV